MAEPKKTAPAKQGLNVWQRVSAVRGDIKAVEKDKQVGTGDFAYMVTTHDAIKAELRPLMAKHGLVDYIIEQTYDRVETGVMRGSEAGKRALISHQGVYTYRCVNIDDPKDSIQFPVRGDGEDTSDKGIGKSHTYALKSGQKILFQIGTDSSEEERIPDEEITSQEATPVSDEQIDQMMELADELFDKEANEVLSLMATKLFAVDNITLIPATQFPFAIKNLKQKHKGEKAASLKAKKQSDKNLIAAAAASELAESKTDTPADDEPPPIDAL